MDTLNPAAIPAPAAPAAATPSAIGQAGTLPDIRDLGYAELEAWMAERGQKRFRTAQVYTWIHQRRVEDFDAMSDVSKDFRETLKRSFRIRGLRRVQALRSVDGSIKYAFGLEDGRQVESVLMPHKDHYTVCVSSQVGCAMGCDFCMTAKMGFLRNLSAGEIVSQVAEASKDLPEGERVRNVVFMGMGEPFHNYDNVVKAVETLTHDRGYDLSQRRVTVSTVGLVPQIKRFGRDGVRACLAVSLNGTDDALRDQLMPVNRSFNLQKLVEACREFPLESRKRITFEYILMAGVTDSLDQAKALVRLLHGLKFKVNLIPYNSSPDSKYQRPSDETIEQFQRYLLDRGVIATLRISKGQDIQGACGQLIRELEPA